MSHKVKSGGIQFNLETISQLPGLDAFKAQEAASHLPNADAIYTEVWAKAEKYKADNKAKAVEVEAVPAKTSKAKDADANKPAQ